MSQRKLTGSRALITGASSGIGRALARELAAAGAKLVLTARREDRLRELAAELVAAGGEAEFVAGDVTDAAVRAACLARAETAYGGLDVLVNNAGVGATGPFAEASEERLRRVMEINFFAAAELTRAALPLLRKGRQPLVVNVGSILGHRAVPGAAEYCASKFALRGLSQSLSAELRPLGIDLLHVSPATTDTEFFDSVLERNAPPRWRSRRPTRPEDVARRIVRAMQTGQRELFPAANARWLYWANRAAPGIVDWVIRRR